jgi:hypothetical protein
LILLMRTISHHYEAVAGQLSHPDRRPRDRRAGQQHMVIFVTSLDTAAARAVGYVRAVRPKSSTAVAYDDRMAAAWRRLAPDIPITIAERRGSLADDLIAHLRDRRSDLPADDFLTVVVPELLERRGMLEVIRRPRKHRLKAALLSQPGLAVLDIPLVRDEIDPTVADDNEPSRNYVIVLVSSIHNATLQAIEFAESLRPTDLRALNFGLDPDETERLGNRWIRDNVPIPLEMQESPFRDIGRSLADYVHRFRPDGSKRIVTVVLPEFVVDKLRHQVLHGQTALLIKRHLLFERGVVVASVPYHLAPQDGSDQSA